MGSRITMKWEPFSIPILIPVILFLIASISTAQRCTWNGVGRIVASGDIHGDFQRYVTLLRNAGLIDESKNWCGGKAHLVQTGDILDRGPDSRLTMDLLMQLEAQAPEAGGQVHVLLGNHEAMLMNTDLRYVHSGEAASHGGMKQMIRALRPTGRYGKWLLKHNSVITINGYLFVHAGISGDFSSHTAQQLNQEVRKSLSSERGDPLGILRGEGPLWYRGWAVDISSSVERALTEALNTHESHFAVIGHTVTYAGIATRFSGRVVMIDTGLSRAYGGPMQYLEIDHRGHKAINVESGAQW